MTLKSRLARVEGVVGARQPESSGPLVLVVSVSADDRGSFSVGGVLYEIGSLEELDACLEVHGWRPQRVIFRLPDLDRSPGAQARFCMLTREEL